MDVDEQFRMAKEHIEKFRKTSEEVKSQASSIMKVTLDWMLLLDHFASLENSLRKQAKNIKCRSEKVEIKSKMVEERFFQVETRERESEVVQKQLKDRTQTLKLKELQLDARKMEAEVLDKKTPERKWELGLVEKKLEGCNRELATKRKQLSEVEKTLEAYNREVESKERRLGLAERTTCEFIKKLDQCTKDLKECEKVLADKRQQLCEIENMLEGRNAELCNAEKDLNVVKPSVEKVHDQLKPKEAEHKVLEEQENYLRRSVTKYSEEHESREKELFTRQLENLEDVNMLSADHLSFILKENVRRQDIVADQVSQTIKRSSDPAKLVLDTVKQFHSLILGKDRNFGLSTSRSCITLLDQFIKISPPILPQVKQEAQKLCREWREMMMVVPDHYLEALGFLKLVAAFRLAPDFAAADIEDLFGTASRHFFPPEFLSALGFPDDMYACRLSSSQVKNQENKDMDSNAINVTTDGRSLFTIISDGHRIMRFKNDVAETFLRPQDPSKVVLDFFTEVGFPASEFRERFQVMVHLTQVSPKVTSKVKDASIPLAKRWKSGMTLEDENTMEAFAFLLYLIVYGVADSFADKDILELVMMIAHSKQAPEICRSLGFADKMPDFIRVLIRQKMHMEAARFICSFGLASKFSVEQLLIRYLEKRRMEAWISNYEINSLKDMDWFVERELEALRAISSFILEFKLDFVTVGHINNEMAMLENEKISRKLRTQTPVVPLISQHAHAQQSRPGATSVFINPQANGPWPWRPLQPHQKRPRTDAYRVTRFVPQTSGLARLVHAASSAAANCNHSVDDDCVITGSSNRPLGGSGRLTAWKFHAS